MRTVYILGAGFSKAICDQMPLMRDLASRVVDELRISPKTLDPFQQDIEAWLSFLSERQPWLSESESLHNQATFLDAARAIAKTMYTLQPQTLDAVAATILDRLTASWSYTTSSIITFNYDLLVESSLRRWNSRTCATDLYPAPLAEREPPGSGGSWAHMPLRAPLPTLFKLHGCLNWMYPSGPSAQQGPIILRSNYLDPPPAHDDKVDPLHSDLEPLIVPPTLTKSTFYANTALRALWKGAAQALREADRVVVIGYSFPPSDNQVATLLRTTLAPDTSIMVVDREDAPMGRLCEILGEGRQIELISGTRAVSTFTQAECGDLVEYSTRWDGADHKLEEVCLNGAKLTLGAADEKLTVPDLTEGVKGEWMHRQFLANSISEDNATRHWAYLPPGQKRDNDSAESLLRKVREMVSNAQGGKSA